MYRPWEREERAGWASFSPEKEPFGDLLLTNSLAPIHSNITAPARSKVEGQEDDKVWKTQTHAPGSPGLRARYRTPRLIVEKENFFGPHLVSLTDTPVSLPTSTYLGVPTIFGYPYYVLL